MKNLANETVTGAVLQDDYVLVTAGGSVRRIKVEDFVASINAGNQQLLLEVAWGVPIKQNASSPAWGVVGNTTMRDEYLSEIGRAFLTNDGKIAKLSKHDSSHFADGTVVDETRGHVMFYSPRLYYLVKEDAQTGIPTLWMSMVPIGGHYIEEQCFGAYKGSLSGGALVSRSGVAPQGAKTITQFWNYAQQNGRNFGLINYDAVRLIIMLNLMEFGNANCQENIGNGVGGSVSKDLWAAAASLLTGATKSMGDACGSIPISVVNGDNVGVDCSRVNLFGIEDFWGWQWEMIQGIFCGNSGNAGQDGTEVFIYQGNHLPSAAELASHPEGDFRQLTRPTTSGYVKKMIVGEFFDMIAQTLSGGSTSYWCDYFYGNNTGQLVLWGGTVYSGARSGVGFAYTYDAWSYSNAHVGSRLAYYGKLNWISGAELMAAV